MISQEFFIGVDIGSTTAKFVVLDHLQEPIFTNYQRHNGQITATFQENISNLLKTIGNKFISIVLTGSSGLGLSERLNLPFIQELTATSYYIKNKHPEIKTIIDIGGEDSKIIFIRDNAIVDMKMNGNCAGGTGSFLDHISTQINITIDKLGELAQKHKILYPIASRCGVFAKTDVQALISRQISLADISASIFHSLALQVKNTLLHGFNIIPKVTFSGGPLSFISYLKKCILKTFSIRKEDFVEINKPELVPAYGSALVASTKREFSKIEEIISRITATNKKFFYTSKLKLEPLFKNKDDFENWSKNRLIKNINFTDISDLNNKKLFLGIDSGSTTTKLVIIDENKNICFKYYTKNGSKPIEKVYEALNLFFNQLEENKIDAKIYASVVTGYGEELIRNAFDIDFGIVETLAHYESAKEIANNVSFILDIGGQDMKAIFVNDGVIQNIEINEACSSGCGSFIENFANSIEHNIEDFEKLSAFAKEPCDLGTRCTVFMNSRVKQYFREGDSIENIYAGLSYSVINNCLKKVLKIYNPDLLGDTIVVQGGTFKNTSIVKAFENIIRKRVITSNIPELMGAYGSALKALQFYTENKNQFHSNNEKYRILPEYETTSINCKGCSNVCNVTKITFKNGKKFYTGNKCENIYSNFKYAEKKGINLVKHKYEFLFKRPLKKEGITPKARIGIPRALNIYENFPFWSTLFVECGFEIVISDDSNPKLLEKGSGTVMSDNICFPAKLTHSHIVDLIEKKVDRIFFPMVTFEKSEFQNSTNSFNCPVVSGYFEVIKSSINPSKYGIPFDEININFNNKKLLKKTLKDYFSKLGISSKTFSSAFEKALFEQQKFKEELVEQGKKVLKDIKNSDNLTIVLAGRPYHIDPLISHNISRIFENFGVNVLTEDSIDIYNISLNDLQVLTQWEYPNRLYAVAKWIAQNKNIELIQLNSFGCGPDAVLIDEVKAILESAGKLHTVIRIDELMSQSSLKLRIRSFVESIKNRRKQENKIKSEARKIVKTFNEEDKQRLILAPYFSLFHSAYISVPFGKMGYKVEILPPTDEESIKIGLDYVNNEICYPAILVIGDLIKALKSGKYDLNNVALALTQTGGQCRASNYISLLKKALIKAGYEKIPVVGVSLVNKILNNQPGFKINKKTLIFLGILGIIFGDYLSFLYYSTVSKEKVRGTCLNLVQKYNDLAKPLLEKGNINGLCKLLHQAVIEFNNVEIIDYKIPKVGIIGEIYVKFNSLGNKRIIDKLIEDRIEVVIPPLINMFSQWFKNIHLKHELNLEDKKLYRGIAILLAKYYSYVLNKFDNSIKNFRFYEKQENVFEIAENAKKVINLSCLYYGEGWLIPGDIISFRNRNIKNIICIQPFGCIANHIVARGIEKTILEHYPDINLLYLDIDFGVSEANIHNRLRMLLDNLIY